MQSVAPLAGVAAPVIVALLRKRSLCENDDLDVVESGDAKAEAAKKAHYK